MKELFVLFFSFTLLDYRGKRRFNQITSKVHNKTKLGGKNPRPFSIYSATQFLPHFYELSYFQTRDFPI